MEEENNQGTLSYIRYVLRELQISPSALAKKAGISPTTLTRPLNNGAYKFNLSATTLEKIADISGINPGPFFAKTDYATSYVKALHSTEIHRDPTRRSEGRKIKSTTIVGYAAVGYWQEMHSLVGHPHSINLTSPYYQTEDCFGVVVADNHAGDLAKAGELLFCVRYQVYNFEPCTGVIVMLERQRDQGRLTEMTVRRLQAVKGGWLLSLLSGDRGESDNIFMSELPSNGEATVVGYVEYAMRQAHWRDA